MKVHGICELCGKDMLFWPSQHRRFCSKSCAGKVKATEMHARGALSRKRQGEEIPCETCGKMHYVKPHVLAEGRGRFCSVPCRDQAARDLRPITHCVICGGPMQLRPSIARSGRVRTCSKRCHAIYRVKSSEILDRTHNGYPVKRERDGYILVHEPERSWRGFGGWYPEHRLVAEQTIGRRLEPGEQVHHINGIKDDNRPENLAVLMHRDHLRLTNQEVQEARRTEREELKRYREQFGLLPKT